MKVSTENGNNFGYEKITILVDNMPLKRKIVFPIWNIPLVEEKSVTLPDQLISPVFMSSS